MKCNKQWMKRVLSGMLMVLVLAVMMPTTTLAQEVQTTVNGFDCARDAGKLVVYTPNYGTDTGTNYWGAEAMVDSNNRVTNIVRGNAEIPEGGFVVSGHDDDEVGGKKMKTWIYENITIGDYVYFDRRTMTLTVSDKPMDVVTSPFFSFDNPADAVNATRLEDHMIVYTPEYGTTTGTNEYGYEVTVEDGVITKLGGNNSVIPQNGYVVSLHGATAKWMRAKIIKGMTADFDPETRNVVFTYSADGLKKAITYSVDKAQAAMDEAKAAFVYADYAATQAAIDDVRTSYQTALDAFAADGDENAFADCCDRLVEQAETLCNVLCDSYPVQYRGVWIRPSQKTAAEVDAYVKELHDACINFVCVEGWFENGVIMNVPQDSLFGRHPSFNFDVLQAYIDACHKYGMECHLWMPILNVGSAIDSGYEERTVTGKKPEWLSLSNKKYPSNKDGFMMIDPANDEARAYMLEFYKYLVTTYDIDCFEMDYIRYYASTGEEDFGYTEAAFAGFEKAYGYGVTPRYDTGAAYWNDWCQYRRDCVTQWVRDIRAMIDREAPDVLLSADVAFPFEHALDRVYQDFPSWLEEGLLDMLHPMAYGDGYGEEIQKAVQLAGDRCIVVTGLGAQVDTLGAAELERQAREDNTYGTYGECYFEAKAYLADHVAATAKQTVYRNEALAPFLNPDASIGAMLDFMVSRIDDVIVPLGGMTDNEAAAVKKAVQTAKESIADGRMSEKARNSVHSAIEAVANSNAAQTLKNDLYRAERITYVKYHTTAAQAAQSTGGVMPWWLWVAIAAVVVAIAATVIGVKCRR